MKNLVKNGKERLTRAKNFIAVKKAMLSAWVMGVVMDYQTATAFAGEVNSSTNGVAEDKWNTVIGFIVPWITRLGGVVILLGAIEFGLAFKNDDAEGKTKGMRTIIAGCIVTAVGFSSDLFLA